MNKNTTPFIVLAVIILIEYFTLGLLFRKNENVRRAVGIGTIMAWSYPLALEKYGAYGEEIWKLLGMGFLTAGAVKIVLDKLTGRQQQTA